METNIRLFLLKTAFKCHCKSTTNVYVLILLRWVCGCCVRKLYWLDRGGRGVRRKLAGANLDGSDVQTLVTANLFNPLHLALSTDQQVIYWTDEYSHKVCR